ncbi:hypothetical protein [Gracilibacillus saliphilus]|uniref:hypothetical protein n=1 Tax=Gracilibacillus saliphilus TaxID=543890 RepID=UPI0013D2BA4B|nr:hypothetical protein [Gracilibacillus saliphilus]
MKKRKNNFENMLQDALKDGNSRNKTVKNRNKTKLEGRIPLHERENRRNKREN